MTVNFGQKDPITNRRLSVDCWDGKHWRKRTEHDDTGPHVVETGCVGTREGGGKCECHCHERIARTRITKSDQAAKTMDILESGCGTIEIK